MEIVLPLWCEMFIYKKCNQEETDNHVYENKTINGPLNRESPVGNQAETDNHH